MLATFEPPPDVAVVYSDLDGTMLGAAGSFVHDPAMTLTAEPARALLAALEAGIEIVPCSGRAMPGIAGDARILGMQTAIGEMGAVVSYQGGREIVEHLGAYPGGADNPFRLMHDCGAIDLIQSTFRIEPHGMWARNREYTALMRGLADVTEVDAALDEAGMGWCSLTDNGVLHASYLGLPPRTAHVYHLLPRGVSKGAAVAADRARRNIPRERTVALGDSLADLAMAPEVAVIALTADALEDDADLAEAAARVPNATVTTRPGNLGWTDAINAIVGREHPISGITP